MRHQFIIALLSTAALASAQVPPPVPEKKPGTPTAVAAPKPIKIGNIVVNGSVRTRVYDWDWFVPAAGDNSYGYSGTQARISFSERLAHWDWTTEFELPMILGLPSNATAAAPQGALGLGSNYYTANSNQQNTAMLFAKQAFIRLRGVGGGEASFLKIGRFEFLDGSELTPKNATLVAVKRDRVAQRLLASFGWSETGRSFDGVHYSWSRANDNLTIIAAVPTRGAFQVDGWGELKVATGYAAYTHQSGKGRHVADTRAFFLEYDDYRHILKTDDRAVAVRRGDLQNIRIETFGGHSIHAITTNAGVVDLLAFGAVQTGRWGYQKQRAGTLDLEAGFQPTILTRLKPWLRGGYTWGSGDKNPNDSTHGTFFQVLPTPRPYARMPFFNMMNTEDTYGSLVLRPHSKITTSTEFHSVRLSSATDLWYSGGGAFQPQTFGYAGRSTSGRRSLADLYDTSVEYRFHQKLTVTGYFGYAQGLAAMQQIYPKGKDGKFGYIEFLTRF